MGAKVVLEVIAGPLKGRIFSFQQHDTFIFGRSRDCHAHLSAEDKHASRHHFLLEVNPPHARLRDLGSLNGTLVNGKKYGGRQSDESPEQAAAREGQEVALKTNDEVQVGQTIFRITITAPATASQDEPTIYQTEPTEMPDAASGSIEAYRIERILGEGGMGTVHLAKRLQDGRRVALKVMLPKIAVDDHARKMFLREIEVTRALRHSNIVELMDYGPAGDGFFFAMDYCAGGSLQDVLETKRDSLEPDEAVLPVMQALEGLAFAHERAMVHRDLKPQNILLTTKDENRKAKLADFGLAKSFELAGLSGMTATGVAGGTPFFMPREQLLQYRFVNPLSDLWSMGATLYYLLTGRPPRDFGLRRDPIEVILRGGFIPLEQRRPDLPPKLCDAVNKALQDDPACRYPSAVDFKNALQATLVR